LRSGDTVETVNGKAVASWSELRWELIQATLDKQPSRIEVHRPDRGQQEATLPTASLTETDLEGDVLGKLGLTLARSAPTLMEIMPGAPPRAPACRKTTRSWPSTSSPCTTWRPSSPP